MIRIGDTEYAFSDPVLLLSLAGVFVVVLVLGWGGHDVAPLNLVGQDPEDLLPK